MNNTIDFWVCGKNFSNKEYRIVWTRFYRNPSRLDEDDLMRFYCDTRLRLANLIERIRCQGLLAQIDQKGKQHVFDKIAVYMSAISKCLKILRETEQYSMDSCPNLPYGACEDFAYYMSVIACHL